MEIIIFLTSFLLSGLLGFSLLGLDKLTNEPQKFHKKPVPRIGGLAIFLATFIGLIQAKISTCFFPTSIAFLSGFIEDITRKLSEKIRFFILILAALVAVFSLNVVIIDLKEVPVLNLLVQFFPFAVLFTVIAIVGLANAFNMIDGLNGLSSGTALIVLASIMYVSLQAGDFQIFLLSKILFLSTLGFFFWNFPWGKIFLGDGGAYFLGFFIACLVIFFNQKYQRVSDWYPVAVAVYPIFETLFSMFRRVFFLKTNPLKPDRYHLHSLLFLFFKKRLKESVANPLASVVLLIIQLPFVVISSLYWEKTYILLADIAFFVVTYILAYVTLLKITRIDLGKN